MRYLSGDPSSHDHEVDDAAWFDLMQARKTLKYVNEKRLVDHALEFLAAHPDAVGEPEVVARIAEPVSS